MSDTINPKEQPEWNSQNKAARMGQAEGAHRTGLSEQDCHEKAARTGQAAEDS